MPQRTVPRDAAPVNVAGCDDDALVGCVSEELTDGRLPVWLSMGNVTLVAPVDGDVAMLVCEVDAGGVPAPVVGAPDVGALVGLVSTDEPADVLVDVLLTRMGPVGVVEVLSDVDGVEFTETGVVELTETGVVELTGMGVVELTEMGVVELTGIGVVEVVGAVVPTPVVEGVELEFDNTLLVELEVLLVSHGVVLPLTIGPLVGVVDVLVESVHGVVVVPTIGPLVGVVDVLVESVHGVVVVPTIGPLVGVVEVAPVDVSVMSVHGVVLVPEMLVSVEPVPLVVLVSSVEQGVVLALVSVNVNVLVEFVSVSVEVTSVLLPTVGALVVLWLGVVLVSNVEQGVVLLSDVVFV